MAGLLDGMRVLDLSAWRPMPHATQILADLGAEVLKVEPPTGDPMRAYPEIFASVARGKRSIALDLRTDAGRERALSLAAEADVVCEGWRPGVAARLGLDADAVTARNPAVVYCSLSGFGQTGPMRDTPGHDLNFQALAGAVAPRTAEEVPQIPRLPVADLEGGTMCALLICAAWARRLTTGAGERIDVAMADVVAWWVGPQPRTVHDGEASGRRTGSPGYGVFRTSDGAWIALGVLAEQRLWSSICEALDLDALADLDFGQRLARTDEINAAITDAVAHRTSAEALTRLQTSGAPVSEVTDPRAAMEHPQFVARGLFVDTPDGRVPQLPALLDVGARASATSIPSVGEHPDGFLRR